MEFILLVCSFIISEIIIKTSPNCHINPMATLQMRCFSASTAESLKSGERVCVCVCANACFGWFICIIHISLELVANSTNCEFAHLWRNIRAQIFSSLSLYLMLLL